MPGTRRCARRTRKSACRPSFVEFAGYLPDHQVVTGFRVTPVVGFVNPDYRAAHRGGRGSRCVRGAAGFHFGRRQPQVRAAPAGRRDDRGARHSVRRAQYLGRNRRHADDAAAHAAVPRRKCRDADERRTRGCGNCSRIMERLRAADGCPWDREQTFASIAPYTIEEAYEVADAIERGDMQHLKDELGDLLFQVVFHAQMARGGRIRFRGGGRRDLRQAACAAIRMCSARAAALERGEQSAAWEDIKAAERSERHDAEHGAQSLDGVPQALPALMRAYKLSKRAARVGFDFEHAGQTADKVAEELAEVREAARAERARASRARTASAAVAGDLRGDRRSIVRGRQSGAQARCRCRGGAARGERQIRAALSRHGSAWRRSAARFSRI